MAIAYLRREPYIQITNVELPSWLMQYYSRRCAEESQAQIFDERNCVILRDHILLPDCVRLGAYIEYKTDVLIVLHNRNVESVLCLLQDSGMFKSVVHVDAFGVVKPWLTR